MDRDGNDIVMNGAQGFFEYHLDSASVFFNEATGVNELEAVIEYEIEGQQPLVMIVNGVTVARDVCGKCTGWKTVQRTNGPFAFAPSGSGVDNPGGKLTLRFEQAASFFPHVKKITLRNANGAAAKADEAMK